MVLRMIVSLLGSCTLVVAGCLMSAAAPIDGTFNYQARLTSGGVPITGTVDARFSLWDAAAAGTQIGSSIEFLGESVSDGLYNADLDFGVAALNGDVRWLQVEVRSPAGVGAYVILGRREILGAPYAIQTRGLFVDDDLNVGIGTTSPKQKLHNTHDYYGRGHIYLFALEGDGSSGTAYLQARDDSGTSSIGMQLRTQDAGQVVDTMYLAPGEYRLVLDVVAFAIGTLDFGSPSHATLIATFSVPATPSACSEADVTTQGAGSGDPLFGIPDGIITAADINYYVNLWVAGCP